ncbi:MAG: hypothetical protein CK426_07930 [Legionella sp.]|nr:MAG: hypothetical protein CK423_00835 [Legionella sp.]PJD97363.1 MAG: hypothetical protein CK426_07930 [Legionella sp.]
MTFFSLHLLRPWWLLALFPLLVLILLASYRKSSLSGWSAICDPHLLAHLSQGNTKSQARGSLWIIWCSCLLLIIALSGPAWHQLPVAAYKPLQAHMLLLDVSDPMMTDDLTPNRLSRAKFKLHDLLKHKEAGQFGLIAYTEEPFVVSPLTDDGQTITSLLNVLTPDIMPVKGQRLDSALQEAARLIEQAGYAQGQILVLTSSAPSALAIEKASALAKLGIQSSIMPILPHADYDPLFKQFAKAGGGLLLPYEMNAADLEQWLAATNQDAFKQSKDDLLPVWQDEGRWFLFPALLLWLLVFQRGWLQRFTS